MHPFFMVLADTWSFDPAMLNEGTDNADVSVLNNGGQLPGTYLVDIVLNGKVIDSKEIAFREHKDTAGKSLLSACITSSQLRHYGLKTDDYPELESLSRDKNDNGQHCAVIGAIPQASMAFNFYQRRLLLSIPQAALRPRLSGIAPDESWDDGIPAFLMNYRANLNHNDSRVSGRTAEENKYVQLEPGVNFGPWRLRNLTTWQQHGNEKGKWQTAWNYAERGLNQIKSRLTVGDRYSGSEVFEGIPFRGIMLETDEAMMPWSEKEFAPVIHGIARTTARIEVKRSGYTIYSATVAPGPFVIRDLPQTTAGEDLDVTVFETNGRQNFIVPSSSPAVALREGSFKYNLMAGRYRPISSGLTEPYVGQMSFIYGLPRNMTVFGGYQGAKHYLAVSQGLGVSLNSVGALSVDDTVEKSSKRGQDAKIAHALRIRYSKNVGATNTGFYLTANRYSASGYSGISGVLDSYESGSGVASEPAKKSRVSLTMSQSLRSWGYLSLAYSKENFWNSGRSANEFSATWGNSYRDISWALSWSQRYVSDKNDVNAAGRRGDQQFNLWLSVPLEAVLGRSARVSLQSQRSSEGRTYHELSLNGDGFDNKLSWDIRQQLSSDRNASNRSNRQLDLTWRGGYGMIRGSYGYSDNSRQINAGISGGMLVHQHGLTLGQPLGNTAALVEVPGASGIDVKGPAGVQTDFRGYTMVSYLSPYQENLVRLKPASFSNDLEILNTDVRVVPTAGAIVPARFRIRAGGRAIITLMNKNRKSVPFGSLVTLNENNNVTDGIVGDKGEVYLSGLPDEGKLKIYTGASNTCIAHYRLPQKKGPAGIYMLNAVCI